MRTSITFLLVLIGLAPSFLFSQTTKDKVVPLSASVQLNPPQVTLSWSSPATVADVVLFRREKSSPDWFVLLSDSGTDQLTFVDSLVEAGRTYEYGIQRYVNNIYAYGYLSVVLEAPVTDHRGTMLVFVEEALQQPLAVELARLETDLVGDGWKVIWHSVASGDNVAAVKSQIVSDYDADPQNVKSVFLFGEIPVPYSGDAAWDGHPDHQGAWPADTYYGDVDFEWLDELVNNTTPARPENVNVPGDGKFDHSITPTTIELSVGRVDFSNLSETTFGTTKVELYRRYLDKNHNWRTGQYQVENKAIVDDNFGYFAGEAFASSGYRNGNALVGEANVMDGDFLDDTGSQHFLLGYGCGPGSYTQAAGVGNSIQFASDTVNVAFSMIFGSYHGDWDYSPNPLLPSVLASRGGILSVSWAGRPHWFYHQLATGETLGHCALETQNACDNPGYFGSTGECGAHVTLLGDPSLRAQVVAPPANLEVFQACNTLEVVWEPSPQSNVLGYHVYRSVGFNGDYTRLTSELVNSISYTDSMPPEGLLSYQVRAVVLEETPGGSFYNTSTGAFTTYDFTAIPPLNIQIEGGEINCANPQVQLTSSTNAQAPLHIWIGPGGFEAQTPSVTVAAPGEYTLFLTDLETGCMGSNTFTVEADTNPPDVFAGLAQINCANETAQLVGISSTLDANFSWSGPNGFSSTEQNPIVTEQGLYTLTVTNPANSCAAEATLSLTANLAAPVALAQGGELTCDVTSVQLQGASNVDEVTYHWTGPAGFSSNLQNPFVNLPGFYTLVVTDTTNGCSGALSVVVTQSGDLPGAEPSEGVLTCVVQEVTLMANPDMPGYDFHWVGPGGFSSNQENPVVQAAGVYYLTVTNPATGCSATFETFVLADTIAPVISLSPNVIELNCITTSIILECPVTIPEILCSWQDSIGNPIPPGTPVTLPGPYFLVLTSMLNGCSSVAELTIKSNVTIPDLTVSGDFVLDCADDETILTVESTSPNVVFQWISHTFPDPLHPVVGPGTYTVVITDLENGCTNSETVTVTAPPPLQANVAVSSDCDGNVDFNLMISGGTAPYSYTISPLPPFPSGTLVSIAITDAAGCALEVENVLVEFPPLLTVEVNGVNETVAGANDGMATAQPAGGTPPYQYLWSNGQTASTAVNLAPGDYSVIVTDANGCTETGAVTILPGTSGTEDIPGLQSLVLFPNPASDWLSLSLTLENREPVQVLWTDVSGRILQTTTLETVQEKTWLFDLSGHAPGVYFCKIQVNGQAVVRKVVKVE